MKKVTVIGSYNVGLFLKGEKIPAVGQTVIGDEFYEGGGGKGSNQAVAAAKLGACVSFIGRIGDDKYGQDALRMYERFGISRDSLIIDKSTHSGISVIFIDKDGNNSIMVALGANLNLCNDDIDNAGPLLKESEIVGFQLENSAEVVSYGIEKAYSVGAKVLLDPAPVQKIDQNLYKYIYILKPNEHEASLLTGIEVCDRESGAAAGKWFLEKGVKHVVVTLGEKGVMYISENEEEYFETPKVKAVDTTGAGDCFSGALMTALCYGKEMKDAIIFANHAAALSVTRKGVVDAAPTLDEVVKFINQ
jgi:ribokinase